MKALYRERERIKRKADRWRRAFQALPPEEAAAVLSAIQGKAPEPTRGTSPKVTVLCVHATSHYKTMRGVDAYDETRDARTWQGGTTVVAHPPCAQCGVLEHPAGSKL